MKASELRIDNWVYNEYTKKEMQVYPMMIAQLARTNGDNNIKPITLTEEWLVKFGYNSEGAFGSIEYVIYNKNMSMYRMTTGKNKGKFFWHGVIEDVEIKYVHQLQNLFFALTGKELKVK